MNKYHVILCRDITQSVHLLVEAEDRNGAIEAAREKAEISCVPWDFSDTLTPEIYYPGEGNCWPAEK